MGEVGFLYRSSVVLGCMILMSASIACTGWFFYSWLGGIPGMVGAGVGCAVQIMAYGFSGIIVHQMNGMLRVVLFALISSALALSILSSYATLNGYFSVLQQRAAAEKAVKDQKNQALQAAISKRVQLMESMSRDVELGSEAANQGLNEKYRTQASQFLQSNAATRDEMAAQIERVEALALSDEIKVPEQRQASPIDGLASVLGSQNFAITLLCIWLAVMFDALPIVGITLFESRKKRKNELKNYPAEKEFNGDYLENAPAIQSALPNPSDESRMVGIEANPEPDEKSLKLLTNICSTNLKSSKWFFNKLLNMDIKYDSDWYVQLCSPDDPSVEFGVIQYDHELVPRQYRQAASGMFLTFVVPDVNETYKKALELGVEIIQKPRNEFYGQRRFLAREPSGCLVDICTPWEEEPPEEVEVKVNNKADEELTA